MKIQKNGAFSTCLLHSEKAPLGISAVRITFASSRWPNTTQGMKGLFSYQNSI